MTGFFEDHLNLDTVVAYADGELSLTAYQRAAAHLMCCTRCAAEVDEQAVARTSLRSAPTPAMPSSLAAALCSIPVAAPVSRTPGIGMDGRTGHAIRVSHLGAYHPRGRRLRLGAGALVAGIAVGAFATAGAPSEPPARSPANNPAVVPVGYSPAAGVPLPGPPVPNTPGR